jgi:hypothetical protein
MKFALLIYGDESEWSSATEADRAAMYEQHATFGAWLGGQGFARAGEELHASAGAKTVRAEAGSAVVSDGPYAETKEQLGGIYLNECPSMDAALEAARRLPATIVEVRQVVEDREGAG